MITHHLVGPAEIAAIAADTFGTHVRVEAARPITPIVRDGVIERAGPTRNPSYVVRLAGMDHPTVFRFHAGVGQDRYDHEATSYQLLARHTGVRVPRIHRIDRSLRFASTPCMVLDYLRGEPWRYLTDPKNQRITAAEKAEIGPEAGRFYARVHAVERPAGLDESESTRIAHMLAELPSLPFFRTYQSLRPVDYDEVIRVAAFHQLGLWGNLLHAASPDYAEWIRIGKGPLIRELVERVGGRAEHTGCTGSQPARSE